MKTYTHYERTSEGSIEFREVVGGLDREEVCIKRLSYVGHFSSLAEYARSCMVESLGEIGSFGRYLDYSRIEQDVVVSGDILSEWSPSGGVHIYCVD